MNDSNDQNKAIIAIIAIIGTFVLLFVWWPSYYDKKHPQTKQKCIETSKKQEVITKLDGGVASYKTEEVYGCEYPDGTFIPAPLPD